MGLRQTLPIYSPLTTLCFLTLLYAPDSTSCICNKEQICLQELLFHQEHSTHIQLVLRGVERLKNLFKGNRSRSEVVATFIAILEMCKTGSVVLEDDNSGENPNVRLINQDQTVKE